MPRVAGEAANFAAHVAERLRAEGVAPRAMNAARGARTVEPTLAAAEGAALNVRINIPSVTDEAAAKRFATRQDELLRRARELAEETRTTVDEVLSRS